MPIWGWVVLGVVVLGIILYISSLRQLKYYREHAESMVGWLVQANTALFEKGSIGSPAQVLVCFDDPADEPDENIGALAQRVFRLKGKRLSDPTEAKVSKLVTDESYRPYVWNRLPKSFTDGRTVYSMHLWIDRAMLPDRILQHPFVRCRILRNEPGTRVMMEPYRDEDDDWLS
jgi:hypothetical protein